MPPQSFQPPRKTRPSISHQGMKSRTAWMPPIMAVRPALMASKKPLVRSLKARTELSMAS